MKQALFALEEGSVYGWGKPRISSLQAATIFLYVFNMSATMARQGGWVQLKQSDMCLALNVATMAKEGFSRTAIEETQFLFKKPRAEVREEKKRGVEFPGHRQEKAGIEKNPAMLRQNQMAGCIPCRNAMPKNPQTRWRPKGTGAPPPDRRRQPTPEETPPLPETPPTQTGNSSGAQRAQIINLPAGYAYSPTSPPCAEFFTLDASAQDSQHNTDFDPDMLTDEGTSTG